MRPGASDLWEFVAAYSTLPGEKLEAIYKKLKENNFGAPPPPKRPEPYSNSRRSDAGGASAAAPNFGRSDREAKEGGEHRGGGGGAVQGRSGGVKSLRKGAGTRRGVRMGEEM